MATAKKDAAEIKTPVKKRAAKKRKTKSKPRAKKLQQLEQHPEKTPELKKQLTALINKSDAKTLLVIRERLMRATEYNCQNPESVPENITSQRTGITITRAENLNACFNLFTFLNSTL